MEQIMYDVIESLCDDGCSIMPAKDKFPFRRQWKKYVDNPMGISEIRYTMAEYDLDSICLLCGGEKQIETIDIDDKYLPGIGAKILSRIHDVDVELYDKLLIGKTLNNGYHIYYKIDGGEADGNKKLCKRHATNDELIDKPNEEYKCFVETRGKGGLVVIPPSNGYNFIKFPKMMDETNVRIPKLTWLERCSLMSIVTSFNQVNEIPKSAPSNFKDYNAKYDKDPVTDFNNRFDVVSFLDKHGWSYSSEKRGQYIYFTRPGKDKGVSASFNTQTRYTWIYTSSTGLDSEKGYSPFSLFGILEYNSDFKKAFQGVIELGFGELKPAEKKKLTQLTTSNILLGKNYAIPSQIDNEEFKEHLDEQIQMYPYGIFWEQREHRGKIVADVDRTRLYEVMDNLGFRLYKGDLVRVKENEHVVNSTNQWVFPTQRKELINVLKNYTQEAKDTVIRNAIDAFSERHLKHIVENLRDIKRSDFLNDDKSTCYKFFKNCIVFMTKDGVKVRDYASYDNKLFHDYKFINYEFKSGFKKRLSNDGKWIEFVSLASTSYGRAMECASYLIHDFKSSDTSYIIGLTEECENPKNGGGAGKNLFMNLLGNLISIKSVPGEQVKMDERFLQQWDGERVYSLSDVPKRFNYMFLKELITGAGTNKKLWSNIQVIEPEDMPKFAFSTNFSFNITDGALARRGRTIEFTDFFTRSKGVDVYFAEKYNHPTGFFPENRYFERGANVETCWTEYDWDCFFYDVFDAMTLFLSRGCKIPEATLSDGGWNKAFTSQFGDNTMHFIEDTIQKFVDRGFVSNEDIMIAYNSFCDNNGIPPIYKVSRNKLNDAMDAFCKRNHIEYNKDARRSPFPGSTSRVRGATFVVVGDNRVVSDFDEIDTINIPKESDDIIEHLKAKKDIDELPF